MDAAGQPRKVESSGVHLKALTLRGFKSFASATTLRFEPGITCVVGPNGSGKSNVVDALCWVMGEQGAKSLRGGKMEDVIFAGTTGRPPLGRAEVSLTIDNSDGALPIEYAEVTITRIMFRNGGSEYQINGDTCRLLDIQELLSDSGIGREMHVIVGQGQLDSVLHADPMGRRAFIEEAAGVLKHRKRKEKALRKLDAMQANLARVQDLTDELRRQLKPLGRQAAVARRAAVIQADLRDARLRLLADDLVPCARRCSAEIADEAALKERKEAAEAELRRPPAARGRPGGRGTAARAAAAATPSRPGTSCPSSPSGCAARSRWPTRASRAPPPRPPRSGAAATPRTWSARPPASASRRPSWRPPWRRPSAPWRTPSRTAPTWNASSPQEERRLKDVARAIADRREGLARLHGQVNAARSPRRLRPGRDRPAGRRPRRGRRSGRSPRRRSTRQLKAEVDGLDADDAELAERHEAAKRRAGRGGGRADARPARRPPPPNADARRDRRPATRPSPWACAARTARARCSAAQDRLTGLLGPAAELLTVAPGPRGRRRRGPRRGRRRARRRPAPPAAADAIRLLRKQDAGRAALLLLGRRAPGHDARPAGATGRRARPAGRRARRPTARRRPGRAAPPTLPAVRRLLRGIVVVGTLEDAEDLVCAHPELTAVTAEGDLLGAHFAHGGSAGRAQPAGGAGLRRRGRRRAGASWPCGARSWPRRSSAAAERRAECAALVEELGERRRAADREKSAGRPAARPARRAGPGRRRRGRAVRRGRGPGAGSAGAGRSRRPRSSPNGWRVAEEMPVRGGARHLRTGPARRRRRQRPADRDGGPAPGPYARGAGQGAGRAGRLARPGRARRARGTRACRAAAGPAAARGGRRRGRRRRRPAAARPRRGLRSPGPSEERAAAERGQGRARAGAGRARGTAGRDLKAELDKLTDSVHRGEVLGAEKRLRIEQLETKALEELGVEPAGLVAEYGPDQLVPPSPPAEGEELPEDPEHPRNQPRPFVRAEQEKRLKAAERAYQQLGKVNPLALEEFAALEERHKFLSEQLEDLKKTRADLLQVVKEVDERVEQVFTEAYRDTAREFEGVFSPALPGRRGAAGPHRPRQHAHHRRGRGGPAAGQEGQAAVAALRRRALADRRGAAGVDLQGPAEPVLRDGRGRGGARRHQPAAADPDHGGAPGEPRS